MPPSRATFATPSSSASTPASAPLFKRLEDERSRIVPASNRREIFVEYFPSLVQHDDVIADLFRLHHHVVEKMMVAPLLCSARINRAANACSRGRGR